MNAGGFRCQIAAVAPTNGTEPSTGPASTAPPATTAAPEAGCGSCCTECTSQILTQCSSTFSSTPPFWGTVHAMPNTILDTDPTAYVSVSTASDGIVDLMWGPDGWSHRVFSSKNIFLVFSLKIKFHFY